MHGQVAEPGERQLLPGDVEQKAHGDGGHQGQEQLAPHDSQGDQRADGKHKVPQAAGNGRGVVLVLQIQLGALRRVDLSGLLHPAVGLLHPPQLGHQPQGEQGHQRHRRDGVEDEGDHSAEGVDGAPVAQLRDARLGVEQPGKEHRPGGEGQQGAHRRAGGVDDVGQGLPGHLLPVSELAHAGAQGHDIQIVVHKDQNPHDPGHNQRGSGAPAKPTQQPGEAQRPVGGAQQGDQRAEQAAHHEHPLVALVGGHPEKGVHPAEDKFGSINDQIGNQGTRD